MNNRFEEFGEDRLRSSAESNAAMPPGDLVNTLLDEVNAFCGKAPQADDMTIMAVQRLPA